MAEANVSQSNSSNQSLADQPLSKLLEAVMAHPDTPNELYNAIGDATSPNGQDFKGFSDSAEFFQTLINWRKNHADPDSKEVATVLRLIETRDSPEPEGGAV